MTPTEAYKIGFMLKCAELGVDPDQTADNLVKKAFDLDPISAISKLLGVGANTAATILKWGVLPTLGVGTIGGGIIGHYAARGTTPRVDVGNIKEEEKMQAYEEGIARLRKNLRRRGVNVDNPSNGWFG